MLWSRWEEITSVRGMCILDKIIWYTIQDKYRNFDYFISVNFFYSYSCSLAYAGYITLKQQYIPHINTNFPVMVFIYSLSAIEKVLQDLINKY